MKTILCASDCLYELYDLVLLLRHSGYGVVLLGLTGLDGFSLQRVAGHSNITTTRKYVHPTPQVMKDAFKKKVQNERRERRSARKRSSNVVVMKPAVELESKAAVFK